VALTLPKGAGKVLTPVFNDRPSGLELVDGKLTGEVGKAAVHIYRLTAR
jgi:hypothetical protein